MIMFLLSMFGIGRFLVDLATLFGLTTFALRALYELCGLCRLATRMSFMTSTGVAAKDR